MRLVAILGLLSAAFWVWLPWLGCAWNPVTRFVDVNGLRVCTLGFGAPAAAYGLPGFTGPYWGNLIVGIAYIAAAIVVARTKRAS
jgi:hypothetical protein